MIFEKEKLMNDEMLFKETFPKLSPKVYRTAECEGCDFRHPNVVSCNNIQKHCLDKERVKKTIEEVSYDVSGKGEFMLHKKDLLKGLGL